MLVQFASEPLPFKDPVNCGHARQAAAEVAASTSEYEPAGHSEHSEDPLDETYLPAVQGPQADEPGPDVNCPAGQSKQPSKPVTGLY